MEAIQAESSARPNRPNRIGLWLAKRRLGSIEESLEAFDFMSCDEPLNSCKGYEHFSHDKEYGRIGAVALFDGMAVLFTTKGKLSDNSHKFILPSNSLEESSYHVRSFNVDPQSLGADPIDLHGVLEIAKDTTARRYLGMVARSLKRSALAGEITEPSPKALRYPPDLLGSMQE